MARIAPTTWGSCGDLNPFLGLGAALKEHGGDPVLAEPGYCQARAQSKGMRFRAIRPDMDPTRGGSSDWGARRARPAIEAAPDGGANLLSVHEETEWRAQR